MRCGRRRSIDCTDCQPPLRSDDDRHPRALGACSVHRAGYAYLTLRYNTQVENHSYAVSLVSTVLPSGGRRWWFKCPLKDVRVANLCRAPGDADTGTLTVSDNGKGFNGYRASDGWIGSINLALWNAADQPLDHRSGCPS